MEKERQTLAVVLRTADYKDNDKIITLLTRQYGRMSAKVRGAKKQASKLFPAASLFCCGDYAFYEKGGRFGVKSCEIKRTFFGLQSDYEAFSAACFVADAVDKVAQEEDVSPGLFSLTTHTLYALDTAAAPPRTVLCYFLQRLLHIEGVYPFVSACAVCGSKQQLCYLSPALGGAVCSSCEKPPDGIGIDAAFTAALRGMARTAPRDIGTIGLDDALAQRLCTALLICLEHVLQRRLVTSRFINGG